MTRNSTSQPLGDGAIDPDFDGLLEAIVRGDLIPAEDRGHAQGWWCEDDVRTKLLVRFRALARGTAAIWQGIKEKFANNPIGPPEYPVPDLNYGFRPDDAACSVMLWGFLIGWYGNYEAGVRDLAVALGIPLTRAGGGRRYIVEIAGDVADRALPEAKRAEFKAHFRLCQNIRNMSHNGGVHDPHGQPWETNYKGQTFRFEPGRPPQMPSQWHPFLRFAEAVRNWSDLIFSEEVTKIGRIESSVPLPPL